MSYPSYYDMLLSKDDMLKGLQPFFDNLHIYMTEQRKSKNYSLVKNANKVLNYTWTELAEHIRNHKPDYLDDNLEEYEMKCPNGDNHIITRPLDNGRYGCELCDSEFRIFPILIKGEK